MASSSSKPEIGVVAADLMSSIVDAINVGIVVVDRHHTVLLWNHFMEAHSGVRANEIVAKNLFEAIPGLPEKWLKRKLASVFHLGNFAFSSWLERPFVFPFEATRSITGELDKMHQDCVFIPVCGSSTGTNAVCLTIHDATDTSSYQMRLESINEALRRETEVSQTKSEFLANVSHELRTPLNAIIGMTGLLINTELDTQQREFALTTQESANSLLNIIDEILCFSRIEARQIALRSKALEVRECVESAFDAIAVKAASKRLNLAYEITSRVPGAIIGDAARIRQILTNLLGNAEKFTESGEILLSVDATACQPIREVDHRRGLVSHGWYEIHFSVQDTGIGIPEDRMNRLFQPFNQVDVSTTRQYGGTGLGLAICKRLVEMMGGEIWVESAVGHGSRFHFTIRAEAAQYNTPDYLARGQPVLRGKRLLIASDSDSNRRIIRSYAHCWGMEVRQAVSSTAALQLFEVGESFDAVIIDIRNSRTDGLVLAETLRSKNTASELPMVLLDSRGFQDDDQHSKAVNAVVTKPVRPGRLYNSLLHPLARVNSLSPQVVVQQPIGQKAGFDVKLASQMPLHILVVDDNAVNRRLVLLMLKRMGYTPDVVENGKKALTALCSQHYDVVLMDIQMPVMDGVEATCRVREDLAPNRQPQIVAVTANALPGDREKYLAVGMDDYISKPISAKIVAATLQSCYRRLQAIHARRRRSKQGRAVA
ncbi:MAG: response regulator [Proteobacteria bacterium]|nr:response regulator [Pseudomonadota bacterium]